MWKKKCYRSMHTIITETLVNAKKKMRENGQNCFINLTEGKEKLKEYGEKVTAKSWKQNKFSFFN